MTEGPADPVLSSGTPRIHRRADAAVERLTRERCHIVELSNGAHDDALSVAQARVEPGVTTRWHRLDGIVERYVVLAGIGRVEVGDDAPAEVRTGDVVVIGAGVRQRITNVGATDLVFLALCTPRFEWRRYAELPDD